MMPICPSRLITSWKDLYAHYRKYASVIKHSTIVDIPWVQTEFKIAMILNYRGSTSAQKRLPEAVIWGKVEGRVSKTALEFSQRSWDPDLYWSAGCPRELQPCERKTLLKLTCHWMSPRMMVRFWKPPLCVLWGILMTALKSDKICHHTQVR